MLCLGTNVQPLTSILAGGVFVLALVSAGRRRLGICKSEPVHGLFPHPSLVGPLRCLTSSPRSSLDWMVSSTGGAMAVVVVALLGYATQFPLPPGARSRNIAVRTGLALVLLSLALFGWLRRAAPRTGSALRAAWVSSLTAPAVLIAVVLLWVTVVAAVPGPVPVAISGSRAGLGTESQRRHVAAAAVGSRMIDLSAAVRESEARLKLFMDVAPAAIAMFDGDMRYLRWSARWKNDNRVQGDLFGRSHYDVFPEVPERSKEISPVRSSPVKWSAPNRTHSSAPTGRRNGCVGKCGPGGWRRPRGQHGRFRRRNHRAGTGAAGARGPLGLIENDHGEYLVPAHGGRAGAYPLPIGPRNPSPVPVRTN